MQKNILVNGAVINQVGVLTSVVTDGWLKGNVLEGEYQGYPCAEGTGVCFDGTFAIKKGSKNKD